MSKSPEPFASLDTYIVPDSLNHILSNFLETKKTVL